MDLKELPQDGNVDLGGAMLFMLMKKSLEGTLFNTSEVILG